MKIERKKKLKDETKEAKVKKQMTSLSHRFQNPSEILGESRKDPRKWNKTRLSHFQCDPGRFQCDVQKIPNESSTNSKWELN